jgi:EAL domain-containing protein (putative c-di-GMP-specific phosphodiesterase class I)
MAGLAPDAADAAHRRLAAVLRAESVRGAGAAALTEERFAVIRPAVATPERLAERVSAAAGPGVRPVTGRLPLDAAARAHTARALRYALDRFIEEGPAAAERSFQTAVRRTVQDSNRFKAVVASGRFGLAYQPVVRLQDQSLHHFEALARFEPGQSPAETIRLAEELDLIVDLDLAVAAKVAAVLETCAPEVRIAVNVSALSLTGAGFVEAFAAVGGASETLRRRLLIEVTETVALTDLGQANAAIAALRKRGHAVCIDDFGAGAASLEYLRRLEVDFVKLDGRYVQDAGATPRDATLLKHFVALCRDLSVATVAEKVETQAGAILLRRLGVDLAQGWAFGKPTPEPKWAPPPAPPRAARRVGANDEWR